MIRINKATEYGLMALAHLGGLPPEKRVSAREIAEVLKIPFEITAKTLQRLKETGFVESMQGTHGGYKLTSPLSQFTLAQLMEAIEGPQALVSCLSTDTPKGDCGMADCCDIKNPISLVNERVRDLLKSIPLNEVVERGGQVG